MISNVLIALLVIARRPGPKGLSSFLWTRPSESRLASATAAGLLPVRCRALHEAVRQRD
jgi:hypothetical protein